MVRRHAKIGEYGIHLLNAMIAQEVMQITEVAAYKCKVRVIHNVLFRIFVLVEPQQPSAFTQPGQYLA